MGSNTDFRVALFGVDVLTQRGNEPDVVIDIGEQPIYYLNSRTDEALDQFDAVVLLQGCLAPSMYNNQSLFHAQKSLKEKQLAHLIEKGGVVCALLTDHLKKNDRGDTSGIDLVSTLLPRGKAAIGHFSNPVSILDTSNGTLGNFFRNFASSYNFFQFGESSGYREIATHNNRITAFSFASDRVSFLPCIIRYDNVDFFKAVLSSLFPFLKESRAGNPDDYPAWVDSLSVANEREITAELHSAEAMIGMLRSNLRALRSHKSILTLSGLPLQNAIACFFREVLKLQIDDWDNFQEDLRLLNEDGSTACIFEIKGENGNFKNSHINQLDTHREEGGLPPDFPAVLILNNFRKSESLEEKSRPPVEAQLRHAVRNNILLVRTIDLLYLGNQIYRGLVTSEKVFEIITTSVGWLNASDESLEIIT